MQTAAGKRLSSEARRLQRLSPRTKGSPIFFVTDQTGIGINALVHTGATSPEKASRKP